METVDDVSTNDMNFKHLDTTKDIVITPMNEFGGHVQLNASHTWTAKVSDGNNYVGDYPVTIEPTGIVVNSSDFTSLPAGEYHLEVWEEWIDSNSKKQRTIYPSPQKTIDFTIYANVTDQAEKEIKSIGFQDVVDQAVMHVGMNYVFKVHTIEPDQTATVVQSAADGKNYVTFNIPRGAKGDQGPQGPKGDTGAVGPQGLQGPKGDTDETATNALNVANSVNDKLSVIQTNGGGVNLANGTSSKDKSFGDASQTTGWNTPTIATFDNPQAGQQYTISVNARNSGGSWKIQFWDGTSPTQRGKWIVSGNTFTSTQGQKQTATITWPSGSNKYLLVQLSNNNDGGQISWNSAMLEEGTVAHTWSPAPEDPPSNDSQLVHKTSNETIAGDKAFVGNTTLATTTILEGNYGLRVTTSGIQKTTDGKTWVSANI